MKMTSEDEDQLSEGAGHAAESLKMLLTSKKFRSTYPKVHQAVREHVRTLAKLEAGLEDENEDAGPPKTRADAAAAFDKHSRRVIADVARNFRR